MRVIIAGSRKIKDFLVVDVAIQESQFMVKTVLSGQEPTGVDRLGEIWANQNNIPIEFYPADWKNLDVENCVIGYNSFGQYNKLAGFNRNEEMAKAADGLVAIWDGKSPGTRDMISRARKHGLKVFIKHV